MELTQLTYFCAVANCQTITYAANSLNITQSAVSKAIAGLEAELGVQLFIRSNRRMTLTRDGALFLNRAQSALNELDNAKLELQARRGNQTPELRIRVQLPELLLGILEAYMRRHPDVHLSQAFQSPDLQSALLRGELSFCITSHPFSSNAIEWEPLLHEPIYLLVSRAHPLANQGAVPLSRFAGESFITFNSNPELQQATLQFCQMAGFTPNINYETGETPDLLKMVDMGLGVAFCSSCIRLRRYQDDEGYDEQSSPYRYLRITYPQCSRIIGISYVRDRTLSQADLQFLSFIREYFQNFDRQMKRWFPADA